jgi:hypothetical protein
MAQNKVINDDDENGGGSDNDDVSVLDCGDENPDSDNQESDCKSDTSCSEVNDGQAASESVGGIM